MVITARRDECCLRTVSCNELKAEHAAVKIQRALEVGDFEVDVPDADFRVNWLIFAIFSVDVFSLH